MKKEMFTFFKYLAIAGNILYLMWFVYNAIDDGIAKGVQCMLALNVQCVAQFGFLILVIINIILLINMNQKRK